MDAYTRFPSMAMVVRCLADAFDTRTKSKDLYDASVAPPESLDYRKSQTLLEQEVLTPIREAGLLRMAGEIKRVYDLLEEEYLQKIVPEADIVGIDYEKEFRTFMQYIFSLPAHTVLISLLKHYSGPDLSHLLAADDPVACLLEWLGQKDSGWQQIEADLKRNHDKNNDQTTLLSWRNKAALPSFARLTAMPFGEKHKTLILLARAVAWAGQSDLGEQIIDGIKQGHSGVNLGQDFCEMLDAIVSRRCQTPSLQRLDKLMKDVFYRLLKEDKGQREQEETDRLISDIQKIIDDEGLSAITQGPIDFLLKARWHLFSGDPKKALEMIEKALHWSAYRAGPLQKETIISLLITAAGQNPPDKVALKQAKNLCITFGYDIPSAPEDKKSGRSRSADLIEDWEIDMWAREYKKHTPSSLFFPGAPPKSPVS